MHIENSTKYLGEVFHNSGKTKFNIAERSAKAHAIISEIRRILTDVPIGRYKTQTGLQLRQDMFVKGVLNNSEVWQGLGAADITDSEKINHQLMRFICNSHAKMAVEFLYLESGSLPLKTLLHPGELCTFIVC